MKKLKFGIPKGSLQQATISLFEKSGWKINVNNGRSYFPDINDDAIECTICRAQEMSRYVESGTIDAGLTGRDWIEENESDVVVVDDLVYSKVSQKPARWVLAVPADSPIKELEDLQGKKISTELTDFTRRYFKEK
ncbi:MAG: ATP phosphoribosyltransferase, partial [Desulfobacterales bacterium]|nr:ATP phosphoribosyltransferase [Desulfobacterales bacterium]